MALPAAQDTNTWEGITIITEFCFYILFHINFWLYYKKQAINHTMFKSILIWVDLCHEIDTYISVSFISPTFSSKNYIFSVSCLHREWHLATQFWNWKKKTCIIELSETHSWKSILNSSSRHWKACRSESSKTLPFESLLSVWIQKYW